MPESVSAYDAKTHLSALLGRAERGDEITITRHGRAVARLTPVQASTPLEQTVDEMRAVRESLGETNFDVRSLIDEGRRY